MGGGGAAPPVKLNDVIILIGGAMVLASFVLLLWDSATHLEMPLDDEELPPGTNPTVEVSQTFDMSSGDEVILSLELLECPGNDDAGDCGLIGYAWALEGEKLEAEDWQYKSLKEGDSLKEKFKADKGGEWTLQIVSDSEAMMDIDVNHRWLLPWLMMFVGVALLSWGIWQSQGES